MIRPTGFDAKVVKMLIESVHRLTIDMEEVGIGEYSFKVEGREFVFMEDTTNDHYVACWLNILIYLVDRFSGRAIGEELPKSLAKFLFDFEAEFATLEYDVVKSLKIIAKAVDERMLPFRERWEELNDVYLYSPFEIKQDAVPGSKLVKTLYKISNRFDQDYVGVRRPFLEELGYCEATHLANHQNDLRRLIETFCTYMTMQLFDIGRYSATRHKKPIE